MPIERHDVLSATIFRVSGGGCFLRLDYEDTVLPVGYYPGMGNVGERVIVSVRRPTKDIIFCKLDSRIITERKSFFTA